MSDKYTHAAEGVRIFLGSISAEADTIGAKLNAYAERAGRITKQGSPAEFDTIIKGSAADLEFFAQRIESLLPEYRRNLELLTEGFAEKVKSLDPATDTEAQELEGMRRESRALAETARGVKAKVAVLRSNFVVVRDANHGRQLTQAAHRVITVIDDLFTAYEDLETFVLKVSFSANEK
jgi:hypothetical protein